MLKLKRSCLTIVIDEVVDIWWGVKWLYYLSERAIKARVYHIDEELECCSLLSELAGYAGYSNCKETNWIDISVPVDIKGQSSVIECIDLLGNRVVDYLTIPDCASSWVSCKGRHCD